MLDAPQLAITAVVILAGSTVLSALSFGIGLTTTPVLLLYLDPQTVVVLLNTVSVALLALVVYQTRDHLSVREMTPLAAAGALGAPVGVVALSTLSSTGLRIGIAVLVLALTVVVVLNVRGTVPRPRLVGPLLGFVVGAMITGLAIGGPLMFLYLMSRAPHIQTLRASMSFYYLAIAGTAVVGYGFAGLYTSERVTLILLVTIPALLGFRLASVVVRKMSEGAFRRAVVTVIVVTSLMVLGREALSL